MMADYDMVIGGVREVALAHGFSPVRKVHFYKEYPETICLVNIQKSAWGPNAYINAGVALRRLTATRRPPIQKMPVRWRTEQLDPAGYQSTLSQALDLEFGMEAVERLRVIKNGVEKNAFDLLDECKDEDSALAMASRIGVPIAWGLIEPKAH